MIYFVAVLLKDIFEQGKGFPWQRPESCPRCNHYRLHGHGFTSRFFQGFTSFLYLKCYRCPCCRLVVTMRPDSHFTRIQCSKEAIRTHLDRRLKDGRWPCSSLSHASGRHWLTNLARQTLALLGNQWRTRLMAAFDQLLALGVIPVSRLI
jgi:hypothetical protein